MKVIGWITVILALIALGIFIYSACTDQTFVEAFKTIWESIFGAATPAETPIDDIEAPINALNNN